MPSFPTDRLRDDISLRTPGCSPFSKHVLVYYVPGNPGLIEYYRNFLTYLTSALGQTLENGEYEKHRTQYHVYGKNLLGFDWSGTRHMHGKPGPYSLNDIKFSLIDDIKRKTAQIASANKVSPAQVPVILIGHSIGAWLLLEATAWYRDVQSKHSSSAESEDLQIMGGILLFPTIVDIAKSPNATRAGWILQREGSAFIVAILARVLLFFLPLTMLTTILQVVLFMPFRSAWITASWLKSKHIIRQALHMAYFELLQVTDDAWSSDIWGAEAEKLAIKATDAGDAKSHTRLFFFWGENDHWVANHTRDAIIATRAQTEMAADHAKPTMMIDTQKLPHAFSITDRGAKIVSDKVASWIVDIRGGLS